MSFTPRFKQRKTLVILVVLVAAPLLATLNAEQISRESVSTETKQGGESSDPFGLRKRSSAASPWAATGRQTNSQKPSHFCFPTAPNTVPVKTFVLTEELHDRSDLIHFS